MRQKGVWRLIQKLLGTSRKKCNGCFIGVFFLLQNLINCVMATVKIKLIA